MLHCIMYVRADTPHLIIFKSVQVSKAILQQTAHTHWHMRGLALVWLQDKCLTTVFTLYTINSLGRLPVQVQSLGGGMWLSGTWAVVYQYYVHNCTLKRLVL